MKLMKEKKKLTPWQYSFFQLLCSTVTDFLMELRPPQHLAVVAIEKGSLRVAFD